QAQGRLFERSSGQVRATAQSMFTGPGQDQEHAGEGARATQAPTTQAPISQAPTTQAPGTQEPDKSQSQREKDEVKITPREAEELFHSVDEILSFDSKQTGLAIKKEVK